MMIDGRGCAIVLFLAAVVIFAIYGAYRAFAG